MRRFPSRPRAAVLALAVLAALPAACAGIVVPPPAALPPDAVVGAGDPTRAAVLGSAYVFGNPASVAGNPAAAARAMGQLEHVAVELPYGPRWRGLSAILQPALADGRAEARQALAIAPDAPPQAVIDGLYGASRALAAGDGRAAERALPPGAFPQPVATLTRLNALPRLPRANAATSLAAAEMDRADRIDGRGFGGGQGGRN